MQQRLVLKGFGLSAYQKHTHEPPKGVIITGFVTEETKVET